jgi:hypothetical protein
LPSAIASIANSPYQPALSWSTTMSASSYRRLASSWWRSLDYLEVDGQRGAGG